MHLKAYLHRMEDLHQDSRYLREEPRRKLKHCRGRLDIEAEVERLVFPFWTRLKCVAMLRGPLEL